MGVPQLRSERGALKLVARFSNSEELRLRLSHRPGDWADVVAVRAALRAVPALASEIVVGSRLVDLEEEVSRRVLETFRNVSAAWHLVRFRHEAARQRLTQIASSGAVLAAHDAASAARVAAMAAARCAGNVTFPAMFEYASLAVEMSNYAAGNAALIGRRPKAGQERTDEELASAAIESADQATLDDLELLEVRHVSPTDLASLSLWVKAVPEWVEICWGLLLEGLLVPDDGWSVWIDWYESRLYGESANEAFEAARVQIADEIWDQGPKVVNAHIKELIEEFPKEEDELADWEDLDGDDVELKPPTIPASRPAAVEPVWRDGRLTVPSQPITIDLQQNEFLNALRSLRTGLQSFASDLDGEANIDRRFVAYLRYLAERIPDGVPPQHELFELGHAEEVFLRYAPSVNQEWPELLAARFHAVVRQHDNTMRQAPAWREFKRNALRDTIAAEQVSEAAPIAAQIADALRDDDAREFVDAIVPDTLEKVADPLQWPPPDDAREEWRHAIEAGNELLALDVIESINNILKPIAEVAISAGRDYGAGVAEGFKDAAKKQGPKDGEKAFKWLRRLAIGTVGGGGPAVAISHLIANYPGAFAWLEQVLHFIK